VLQKTGLKRMVIDSFDNPEVVAEAIQKIAKQRLTQKERNAVVALIDPQEVHQDILTVLSEVLKSSANFR